MVKTHPIPCLSSSLTHKKIPGDGQCLFSALSHDSSTTAEKLRQEVIQYIRENINNLCKEDFFNEEILKQEISHLEEGGWGDYISIEMFQRMKKRPVVIFRPTAVPYISDEERSIDNPASSSVSLSEKPIFIYYNDYNHYDAFEVKNGKNSFDVLREVKNNIEKFSLNHSLESSHDTEKTVSPVVSLKTFLDNSLNISLKSFVEQYLGAEKRTQEIKKFINTFLKTLLKTNTIEEESPAVIYLKSVCSSSCLISVPEKNSSCIKKLVEDFTTEGKTVQYCKENLQLLVEYLNTMILSGKEHFALFKKGFEAEKAAKKAEEELENFKAKAEEEAEKAAKKAEEEVEKLKEEAEKAAKKAEEELENFKAKAEEEAEKLKEEAETYRKLLEAAGLLEDGKLTILGKRSQPESQKPIAKKQRITEGQETSTEFSVSFFQKETATENKTDDASIESSTEDKTDTASGEDMSTTPSSSP